jgi:quinolinate synthase
VVTYVNSTAEVKAESDYCCTSGNALKVVEALHDAGEIIFVPDKYLGSFASIKTGKQLILWPGYCPTHIKILSEDILRERDAHPAAKVMVHPECHTSVAQLADEVLSTGGMLKFPGSADAGEFIVGTEIGLTYRLQKLYPEKKFYPASERALCPNMKMITLEKILRSLQEMSPVVKVTAQIRDRSYVPVQRMLEII